MYRPRSGDCATTSGEEGFRVEKEESVNRLELEKVRQQKLPKLGHESACPVVPGLSAIGRGGERGQTAPASFLSPSCWQQMVAVHDWDIAKQMRAEIASMVADGKNEEQIVDLYVASLWRVHLPPLPDLDSEEV